MSCDAASVVTMVRIGGAFGTSSSPITAGRNEDMRVKQVDWVLKAISESCHDVFGYLFLDCHHKHSSLRNMAGIEHG